jgi:L-fucose isomerase-like protein
MENLHIAVVPVGRIHFDYDFGKELFHQFYQRLEQQGYSLCGPQVPLTDLPAAEETAKLLKDQDPDALVVFYGTFADTQLLAALVNSLDLPVFLWAVPEQRTGGRLRLASFPGINLACHFLSLHGRPYRYAYAKLDDEEAWSGLSAFISASGVARRLRSARLGVVGERPAGMETCDLDEAEIRQRLGATVEHIDLQAVFNGMLATDPTAVSALRQRLNERLDNLENLDPKGLNLTLSAYLVMKDIAESKRLDGMAVRCWPEFFVNMGCSACAALSMLSDDCVPATCEADAYGALSQFILQSLAEEPAFTTDIVEIDVQRNEIVFWHCGQAPLALADPDVRPRGVIHTNRKLPMLMDFPLKPGPVTLLRLSRAGGAFQLIAGKGEMLKAPKAYIGTSGVFRFERTAQEFMDRILSLGVEHHISLAYGDFTETLEILSAMLQIPYVRL